MIDHKYEELNPELRMLLFSIERSCGVEVGDGRVFYDTTKRREVSDVRHIFAYISITYLEYTHSQVRQFLGIKYDSNLTYAQDRVKSLIEFNTAYRNRLYNIAWDNGVIGLVKHIIELEKRNIIRYFIIRRVNCGTSEETTDIIGLTTDEEYAKNMQSVFCHYEEVKIVK